MMLLQLVNVQMFRVRIATNLSAIPLPESSD